MLRFWIVVIGAVISIALLLTREPSVLETTAQGTNPTQSREEAYRANNLGVALLEQFKHKEGADQFRKALTIDPKLALARINLAIALFNVPELPAAQREATAATTVASDAPQPYYILGLIAKQQGNVAEGLAAFQRVLKIDPRDVATNVQVGQLYAQQRKYPEAIQAFRTAIVEEPYNGTALYNLGTALIRSGERAEGQRVMQEFQKLRESGSATIVGQNYLEQGRYAEAVVSTGTEPDLVNRTTPEVSFTDETEKILPATEPDEPAGLSGPFYSGATLFDYDGDGDLDLFEVSGTTPRLYRNDGGKFTDVTAKSGAFAKSLGIAGFGAIAGDFDNDERRDLLVLAQNGVRLYRNEGSGKFADVTTAAKIPNYPHVAISAAFADVDHDGDLDIFIAGYAAAPKSPSTSSSQAINGAPNMLLRNNGDSTFTDVTAAAGVAGNARSVAVVPTDYDNRRDVDLLVVNYGSAPQLYRNMRDGSFRDVASDVGLALKDNYTSVAAGDVNKDEFTDFFFGRDDAPGQFAMSDGRGRFTILDGPPATKGAVAAQFIDYDNDGLLDLVTVSNDGLHVHRNVGEGWVDVTEKAAPEFANLIGPLASGDIDGDGDTDLFLRDEDGNLKFLRNDGGNRNPSISVHLDGKVSNRSGVGSKIEARAGSLRQKLEAYAATPAPAPADFLFGIGRRERVDAVRILWPSGVVQAETEFKPPDKSQPLAFTLSVEELDRKPSSCPFLYAWNGERFEFITDFMGGGEIGYWVAPGVRAAPDPDEYVRIRGDQLKERGGRYELRVTNELEEALFIDRLQLVAVAHPVGVEMYPNEGLGNPTSSKFKLYSTRDARPPRRARDDQGRDVLDRLLQLDRKYVDGFRLHRIRGYAANHSLTLDLGDGYDQKLLLLTGWTDYAFSSDNVAAAQTGLKLRPPALQVKDRRGRWRTVIENIGIPVGRPQTVAVDLTGKFLSRNREVRIVTNMRIYWDQILVDSSSGDFPARIERLEATRADLRWRGFSAAMTPDGREPLGYDYTRVSLESPWKTLPGRYTREGDVRELLTAVDDMFVVSRTGDELALEFDATGLQPLPPGWTRTFLLYADGFSKEMDINSASPHELGPLPFHGMKRYPYSAPERFPATPAHLEYLERYNTRIVIDPVASWASLR